MRFVKAKRGVVRFGFELVIERAGGGEDFAGSDGALRGGSLHEGEVEANGGDDIEQRDVGGRLGG